MSFDLEQLNIDWNLPQLIKIIKIELKLDICLKNSPSLKNVFLL